MKIEFRRISHTRQDFGRSQRIARVSSSIETAGETVYGSEVWPVQILLPATAPPVPPLRATRSLGAGEGGPVAQGVGQIKRRLRADSGGMAQRSTHWDLDVLVFQFTRTADRLHSNIRHHKSGTDRLPRHVDKLATRGAVGP